MSPQQAAQEGLRRQEDRARELERQVQPKADVLQPAAPASGGGAIEGESPCFVIREVRFEGPDATRFHWLADAAAGSLGNCLGAQGLRQLAAALDARLVAQGHVTSKVSLPEQNLGSGVLRVRLHIGRIGHIRLLDADARTPDTAWGTARNALPASAGDVLDIRALEQGVEQMRRLPSQQVAMELQPGAQPDTSDVVILRRAGSWRERTRGGITLDNSGTSTLGRTQLTAFLSHDNLLGLNDVVSATASSNLEQLQASHRSQSLGLSYSLPWGFNTFSLSRSHSRFAQTVQGTTVRFLSSGRSESTDLRWHRTVLRTSSAKFGLHAALGTRRASSFLDDVELIVQRRRTSSIETGFNYRQLVGDASLDLEVAYRRGMPWRGAQPDLPTAAQGGLTLRPRIWSLSAAYRQPFKLGSRPFQYSAGLRAQHTRQNTLSIDQIAIGGRHSVRGFDGESVLLAESGYVLRNEWATPLPAVQGLATTVFVGLDLGRVWGPSAALLAGDRLAGAVLGLRGRWRSFEFEAALATPLRKPDGFRTEHWNPYLSASWIF